MTAVTVATHPIELKVGPLTHDLENAWDAYVHHHASSSPFHLSAWKRAIEKSFGFEARYLVAQHNGRIDGILPLFLVKNLLQGRSLISTPFAVYGGVCSTDEQSWQALRQAACQLAREENVEYLELREQWPNADPAFLVKELYASFDLEFPQNEDQLFSKFPRDTRYMIRKAERNRLSAVFDNRHLDVFYEVYAHSVHHLGTPVFPKKFFRTLLEEFEGHSEITTVWYQSRCIAGALSFRFHDRILPYYGGSLLEGRRLAVNNFMYWELMKRAMHQGLRFFDFGRSKVGTGAYAFKTQWSMRKRPLPYQFFLVKRQSMPNYSPVNPRFRRATEVWRHMPFRVTKWLGPKVVRLFP